MESLKTLTILYDYYEELLTEKQKQYFKDYYFNDLSLSEISENYGISKTAISKNINDTVIKLKTYEEKLKLYEKRRQILKLLENIDDKNITDNIERNQTRELMNNMNFNMSDGKEIKTILEEVLIMTSENIHINSFMYEPIIDMSVEYLIKLYSKVCNLK